MTAQAPAWATGSRVMASAHLDTRIVPEVTSRMAETSFHRLILVTTTGQATNALQLIRRKGDALKKSRFLVLFTTLAPETVEIERILIAQGASYAITKLPRQPNSGRYWSIRNCHEFYVGVLNDLEFEEIWISNAKLHFSMFAQMCKDCGKTVTYLEDGLGTYRTAEQISPETNVLPDIAAMFAGLWTDLSSFLNAAKNHLLKFVFQRRSIRALGKRMLPYPLVQYYKVFSDFDHVYARYPEALDPVVFPEGGEPFPLSADDYVLSEDEISKIPPRALAEVSHGTLFATQRFGSDLKTWNGFIADALVKQVDGPLFIKFHPKERPDERRSLIDALVARGVEPCDIDPSNTLDALKIISTLEVRKLVGLTSTVLAYTPDLSPGTEVVSVATDVVMQARSARSCLAAADMVENDFEVLERILKYRRPSDTSAFAGTSGA